MKMYNFRNRKKNISKYMKKVTQALVILALLINLLAIVLDLCAKQYFQAFNNFIFACMFALILDLSDRLTDKINDDARRK